MKCLAVSKKKPSARASLINAAARVDRLELRYMRFIIGRPEFPNREAKNPAPSFSIALPPAKDAKLSTNGTLSLRRILLTFHNNVLTANSKEAQHRGMDLRHMTT